MMAPVITEDAGALLERFSALPAARPLIERLGDGRFDVHLVGGAVRDLMLGAKPQELDLLLEEDLAPVLERLGASAREYDRFGTATVTLDGVSYDLARARRETYAHPGALPDVSPASLAEDLDRRDFTVNAIALGVFGPRRGVITEVGLAREDLRRRQLRVLHDASFRDDPTRLLRLARYASRLNFEIEPHTAALAAAAVRDGALSTVSGARLGTELRLLAGEPEPVAALETLRELGLDGALAPGFGLTNAELARRALELLPADGSTAALALAAAAIQMPRPELVSMLDRLAFEAGERDTIVDAASGAKGLAASLETAVRPSEIAAAVDGAGIEQVALAGALGPAQAARQWLGELRLVKLEINGRDLLAVGVEPGPAVGIGLRAALAAKLDGRAAGRPEELAEAVRAARAGR
jgi:tRNA nucleotidyltransferase (CCA-adding enzyme)